MSCNKIHSISSYLVSNVSCPVNLVNSCLEMQEFGEHTGEELAFLHPQDLIEVGEPNTYHLVSNDSATRLVTTLAFKSCKDTIFHCTLVVDTGRRFHLTISPLALEVIKDVEVVTEGQAVVRPLWQQSPRKCVLARWLSWSWGPDGTEFWDLSSSLGSAVLEWGWCQKLPYDGSHKSPH